MRSACLRAWLALSVGWALGNCSPVFATLINGNFENPNLAPWGTSNVMNLYGWNEVEDGPQNAPQGPNSSVGIISPRQDEPNARPPGTDPFGTGNWGFIKLANAGATFGGFWQDIGVVEADKTYSLFFDVMNIDSLNLINAPDVRDKDTTVKVFFTLGAAGTDFSQSVGSTFNQKLNNLDGNNVGNLDFYGDNVIVFDRMITFTPTAQQVGQSLNLVFWAERPAGTSVMHSEAWFDGVQLTIQTNPVPEPHSLLLAGAGAGLLIARRLRRARRG